MISLVGDGVPWANIFRFSLAAQLSRGASVLITLVNYRVEGQTCWSLRGEHPNCTVSNSTAALKDRCNISCCLLVHTFALRRATNKRQRSSLTRNTPRRTCNTTRRRSTQSKRSRQQWQRPHRTALRAAGPATRRTTKRRRTASPSSACSPCKVPSRSTSTSCTSWERPREKLESRRRSRESTA